MLEAKRSKKDEMNRFKSLMAKYVPLTLNEIQAGFDLDIAKQNKVSFDPRNTTEICFVGNAKSSRGSEHHQENQRP